jgi:N,N'-diacetyllegionaminate synthase
MKLNGRELSAGPVYMIAEAGVNHEGKWEKALDMIDVAKESGADAVKFQLFNARTCKGIMRHLLGPLELSKDAHRALFARCKEVGIDYMASCFDEEQVRFVKSLGCTALKIGSGELTNKGLMSAVGQSNLTMVLSTGMSTTEEVWDALLNFEVSNKKVVLLHCVSAYPTPIEQANLKAIEKLKRHFRLPVGFSDHTLGTEAMIAAVSMGACIVEKHFTMDKEAKGPDHHMSASPSELKHYISTLRQTEVMLGSGEKMVMPCEEPVLKIARGRWS